MKWKENRKWYQSGINLFAVMGVSISLSASTLAQDSSSSPGYVAGLGGPSLLTRQLSHAYHTIYGDVEKNNSELDFYDQNLIRTALTSAPYLDETFSIMKGGCTYLASTPYDDLDALFLTESLLDAQQAELDGKESFYIYTYDALSQAAQEVVDRIISSRDNWRENVESIRSDSLRVAADNPDFVRDRWANLCQKLPGVISSTDFRNLEIKKQEIRIVKGEFQ